MFGKGPRDELLDEVLELRRRISVLEAGRTRLLRVDSVTDGLSARAFRGRVAELTRCAGSQSDPRVTQALIGCLYGARPAGLAVASA